MNSHGLRRLLRHAILRRDAGKSPAINIRNASLIEPSDERERSAPAIEDGAPQGDVLARCATVQGYAGATDRQTVRMLVTALGDAEPLVRWEAAAALAQTAQNLDKPQVIQRVFGRDGAAPLTTGELLAWLRQSLAAPDPAQREAVADALGRWPQQAAVEILIKALGDEAPRVRASAALSLGRLGAIEALEGLSAALGDPSSWVRGAAADALGALGDSRAAGALAALAAEGPTLARVAAISALGRLPSREARQQLLACLADESGEIRWHAARALQTVGTVAALPELERLLGDAYCLFDQPIYAVAGAAIRAIRQREQGAWHAVRHAFFHLWGWLRRLRRPR